MGSAPSAARPRLVLLDLDGTLVSSRGVGRRALETAFEVLYGWREATRGLSFGGLTDPWILAGVFEAQGRDPREADAERERILGAYVEALDALLAREPDAIWTLPGATSFVDALVADPRCVVGVLTGNVERGAVRKLRAAGLGSTFYEVGAFGDEAPTRNALLPVALARINAGRAEPIPARAVVIVGDTPRDLGVARAHGARGVCVATGASSRAELEAAEPDALLEGFDPLEAALAAVLS